MILSEFPILENQTKSAQTLALYSEPFPDNPRENATTSPWAGLQRDLCPVDVWYSPYVTLQRFFIMCAVDGSIWEPLAVSVRDIMRGLCKRSQFIHPAP